MSSSQAQTLIRPSTEAGFEVRVVECRGGVHLDLVGELDSYAVETLSLAIEDFFSERQERCRVVLDLVDLTVADLAGIRAVAATCELLRADGFPLSLHCVRPHAEPAAEQADLFLVRS